MADDGEALTADTLVRSQSRQVIAGKLKDCFIQRHPALAAVDKAIGWTMILTLVACEVVFGVATLVHFISSRSALGLLLVSGKMCTIGIAFIAFMLWHTYCYYDPRMRKLMKTSTRFFPDGFMQIGFVPIPAASSVGLLLFISGVIVAPSIQGGGMLQAATAGPGNLVWVDLETCAASSVEAADYLDRWGSRFDRTPPFTTMEKVRRVLLGESSSTVAKGDCFMAGAEFTQADVIDPISGKDKSISNLINPEGDTEGRLCQYLCASWQTLSLKGLIGGTGSIFAGAAIVVTVTGYVSDKFGIPTVKADTDPEMLQALMDKVMQSPTKEILQPLRTSMAFTALPIILMAGLLRLDVVPKIDADGYATVDSHVVFAMLYSMLLVTTMRFWHLCEQRPNIFTTLVWSEGVDKFVTSVKTLKKWENRYGKGEFKKIRQIGKEFALVKIDLYQWIHLPSHERHELLINKCRLPFQGANEEGSKLVTIGPTRVGLKHKIDQGFRGTITATKYVDIPAGTGMTLVDFKDDDHLHVNVRVDGVMEKVLVDRFSVLEDTDDWDKVVISFVTKSKAHGLKTTDVVMAGVYDVDEPDTQSAPTQSAPKPSARVTELEETLVKIENRMRALEQK